MQPFRIGIAVLLVSGLACAAVAAPRSAARKAPKPAKTANAVAERVYTPEEAKRAVAILDDAYNLILHEVHETYPTKPGRPVAASLVKDLQKSMTAKGWPGSRFLAVNAVIMNPDHRARDEWERRAVSDMKSGKPVLAEEKKGEYRAATMVSLRGGCTSCHWSQDSMGARAAITWKVRTSEQANPSKIYDSRRDGGLTLPGKTPHRLDRRAKMPPQDGRPPVLR